MNDQQLIEKHPPNAPTTRLVWTAIVDVAPRIDLGLSALGHRYMVPILGGHFYAGADMNGLSGTVLPGGADRQLLRPDGVKELDAIYEMQAADGTILSIRNQVTTEDRKPVRYAMSRVSVEVSEGPHDWLNRRLLIGTLQSARPDRQAVIVRAWIVDNIEHYRAVREDPLLSL